jgi:esterase/lipase superfamily enzyme
MIMTTSARLCTLLVLGLLSAACQPQTYLMPSPVGLEKGGELFYLTERDEKANLLHTFYATNRGPAPARGETDRYTTKPAETLRFGMVVNRVGGEEVTWDELYAASFAENRAGRFRLRTERVTEMAAVPLDDVPGDTSAQADEFFDMLEEILQRTFDKDILVYVHGANCSVDRATAQGAQFYHFTGHNSVVLNFAWPSAENILRYRTDVRHARQSVPAFARLIELLAARTSTRRINILAYSAGAQVVAPGLAYFDDLYPNTPKAELKERLRIGEVYFAAPDTAFEPFVGQYLKFRDIVGRTTVNLNTHDAILGMAAMQSGVSRLGSPDASDLTEEQARIFREAMNGAGLNLLDVGDSEPLDLGVAHNAWFGHPWVSMDTLMLLLFNLDPLERGLQTHWHNGMAKTYRFPADYESRIRLFIDEHRDVLEEKIRIEHGM